MSRDLTQAHPQLQEKFALLTSLCKAQGLIIKNTDVIRNASEQADCVNRGTSSLQFPNSMHNWGVATDFCRNDGTGAYNDSDGFFTKVGRIAQSIGLEWGGAWVSPVDKPHLQLATWGTGVTKLKAAYGTPDKFKATWIATTITNDSEAKNIQSTLNSRYKGINGWITLEEDGYFGPYTKAGLVRALQIEFNIQYDAGLEVDGYFGQKTLAACVRHAKDVRGNITYLIQAALYCKGYPIDVDGYFGNQTESTVRTYQKDKSLEIDGMVYKETFTSLFA